MTCLAGSDVAGGRAWALVERGQFQYRRRMAVYTHVDDDELETLLARYDAGELMSYKGIAEGVENTNYIVHTSKSQFILTLYEKRVDEKDLPFFLGLMEHLAAGGVTCPVPMRDGSGAYLGVLAGRPAALVSFLEGFCVHRPKPEHCAQVGAALARFHLAGDGFSLSRANALGVDGWQPLFESFRADAEQIAPGLEALIVRNLSDLQDAWPRGLPGGVIHADLFPDNVFFLNDTLSGLIDFYFACNDAFAYDIAVCLNAWCFERDYAFNVTKGRALLHGYEQVRPLSAAERDAMPVLARGAAMRFLLTRCFDWLNTPKDAVVSLHDPNDYISRVRFHETVSSISDYGVGMKS